MKLSKRTNWILLPIIIVFFALAAGLTMAVIDLFANELIQSRLKQELEIVRREVEHDEHLLKSTLKQLLQSREIIELSSNHNSFAAQLALEDLSQRTINATLTLLPSIRVIQFIDSQGQLLASGDNRPAQIATYLDPIPPELRWWENDTVILGETVFFNQEENGETTMGVILPFTSKPNPRLLALERKTELLYGVITLNLSNHPALHDKLRTELGDSYQLRLLPKTGADPQLAPIMLPHKVTLDMPHYRAELAVPGNWKHDRVYSLYWQLGGVFALLSLITFLALRGLIHEQVLRPILDLANKVKRIDHNEAPKLPKLERNDEIADLHNAYASLVSNMHHLATSDALTGLANRRSFQHELTHLLKKSEQQPVALLYIDLDNFKQVNDHYGHSIGDQLLQRFSDRLKETIRGNDQLFSRLNDNHIARLAGDEFALILPNVSGFAAAHRVATRLLDLFESGFEVDGVKHDVHASIGIAIAPQDGTDTVTLMRHADAAMFRSKSEGKSRSTQFTAALAQQLAKRSTIEKALKEALSSDSAFYLVFMPVYETKTQSIIGAEVLLRCHHPFLSSIGPEEFIPVAESTGLIKDIDLWVMERAFKDLILLREANSFTGKLFINISAKELHNNQYPHAVSQLLDCYAIDPSLIELEVTETSLVDSDHQSVKVLTELKALGLSLALDDFGTGYTAFNQLNRYPVDTLKIDRSFIAALNHQQAGHRPMADIIIELARIFDLDTVAEGIETRDQLERVRELGCTHVQGYFMSRPVPLAQLQNLIKSDNVKTNEKVVLDIA